MISNHSQQRRSAIPEADIDHYEHSWQSIRIRITYSRAARVFDNGVVYNFLEVDTYPSGQPLPIAETGFTSQYIPRVAIESCGGPIWYVEDWLNAWSAISEEDPQGFLF